MQRTGWLLHVLCATSSCGIPVLEMTQIGGQARMSVFGQGSILLTQVWISRLVAVEILTVVPPFVLRVFLHCAAV